MLLLTYLFRVFDLGFDSIIFKPKCPSASVKPANQLLLNKLELFKLLDDIVKLYLLLKKSIN